MRRRPPIRFQGDEAVSRATSGPVAPLFAQPRKSGLSRSRWRVLAGGVLASAVCSRSRRGGLATETGGAHGNASNCGQLAYVT